MLGSFLLVGQKLFGKLAVLLLVHAARPRSGDWASLDLAAVYLDQCFRRCADDDLLIHFQIIHIG
ncbi:hypothetical protein D3C73_1596000 [compost metagenome]